MQIRLTTADDGRVCMHSPYDPDFLAWFKAEIHYRDRSWDSEKRVWILENHVVSSFLVDCVAQKITVRDERTGADAPVTQNPYAAMPEDLRAAFACLYLAPNAPVCVAEASHKALAKVFHPDMPYGDHEIMERLNDALDTIQRYFAQAEEEASIPF